MPAKFLSLLMVCLAVQAASAAPPAPPRFYAYQVRDEGGIAAFAVNVNGDLAPLPFVVPGISKETTLLRHPNRPVLYAMTPVDVIRVDTGDSGYTRCRYRLTVYGVKSDGHITARQSIIVPYQPAAFSPDGKRLYVPVAANVQQVYQVSTDGMLRAMGETGGAGANVDVPPQPGIFENYTLTFAPRGNFAFLYHSWGLLDIGGVDMQRYRVKSNGQFVKAGPEWNPKNASTRKRWETDTGNLTFSGDGRTALMDRDRHGVAVLRFDAHGQLHDGRADVPGQKPSAVWAMGNVSSFDHTGRFVLLNTSSDVLPFRIGQVVGPGHVRETARFGTRNLSAQEQAEKTTSTNFSIQFRPDDFIDVMASNATPEPSRYSARYHLNPGGTVKTVVPWTRLPDTDKDGKSIPEYHAEPIFRTVFVARPE